MKRLVGNALPHAPIGRALVFAVLTAITVLPGARAVSVVDRMPVRAPGGDRVLTFTRADGALAAGAEDGRETSRLALPRGGFVASHAWSRDGRRIALTRCRGRNCLRPSVYVIRADGSDERLVIANAGGAVWMPDQRHLLVDRADKPEHWVVSIADPRSRRRYAPAALAAAPFSPRLSPDGRWLLHLTPIYGRRVPSPSAPHHARARNWLIITDLQGGRSRRVSNERGLYFLGSAPWSPDGASFTFTRRRFLQASGGRIYVASPGGGLQLVAEGARDAGAWSSDGLRLAFNIGTSCAIRVVSIDGSWPPRTLSFKGCLPTWRPSP